MVLFNISYHKQYILFNLFTFHEKANLISFAVFFVLGSVSLVSNKLNTPDRRTVVIIDGHWLAMVCVNITLLLF